MELKKMHFYMLLLSILISQVKSHGKISSPIPRHTLKPVNNVIDLWSPYYLTFGCNVFHHLSYLNGTY